MSQSENKAHRLLDKIGKAGARLQEAIKLTEAVWLPQNGQQPSPK